LEKFKIKLNISKFYVKIMVDESVQTEEISQVGKLFLPSLVISRFSSIPGGIIQSLLLIEMGLTFGLSVGVTGQLGTAGSFAAFISSLLMGILSIRFKNKSLLMTGLLLMSISILGCSQAPSFIILLLFTVLSGLGGAMVMPMTTTLVAKHLPLNKRAGALGLLMATLSVSYLVGSPIINYISEIGGWRLAFLAYALPFPILSLVLGFFGLPGESDSEQVSLRERNLSDGYRGVFSNRSAVACLIGNAFSGAAWAGIVAYSVSFYRQHFMITKGMATFFLVIASLIYTIGALFSSKFVNRFGRKPVTFLSALITGILIFFFSIIPNLWFSFAIVFFGCLFAGIRATSHVSLMIEQVPQFRGTIMSISAASANMGSALGTGIGGLSLLQFGFTAIGPSLGLLGVASAIILFMFAVDPTRTG
jgi:predicted MFS family arabinose efflux permease